MNIIRLPKKFDYSFRDEIYKNIGKSNIVLDFKRTIYMDSTALGLMLMLNSKRDSIKIKLINVNNKVWPILKMANFDMLFKIEGM
jgi:HptB-dependent secretion and biofilm anti anti-sigma factor